MDQFPLEDESSRALSPADDLGAEARLLLEPCADRPEEHLRYTVDGQVLAVAGSRKGKVSIKNVFNLRRSRLKTKRRNKVAAVVDCLQLIREQEEKGNAEAARDFREFLSKWFLTDSARACRHGASGRVIQHCSDSDF